MAYQKPEKMSNNLFRNKYRIPSARAEWHDYNIGYYFITICTDKRIHYFGEIIDRQMVLSQIGNCADSYLKELHLFYDDVGILSYVIMPNHVHLLVAIEKGKKKVKNVNDDMNEKMQQTANKCGRLSHVISRFKSFVTQYAKNNDLPFMWQTRFYDRIIRDYSDFVVVEHYIDNNVIKWQNDEHYTLSDQ